jgi:Ca-activated chloride channel family protein
LSLVALLAALSSAAFVAAQQRPVFRGGIDLVTLGITVTDDKGRLVTGLTADDFDVIEDGRRQSITDFSVGLGEAGQGPALHLGLLLDVSESMGEDLGFTKTAAIQFLNAFAEAVDVTIVDFDTEVRVARYSQRDVARVVDRIRQRKAKGRTALYDAIGVYLDGAAAQDGRKIMLLYTDGGDTTSAIRYRELIDLLKASDITAYVIGQLDHQTSSERNAQRFILEEVADTTGGQAFFPTSVKDLSAAYEKVLAQIHAQYVLGYQSSNDKADGAWRKVDIKVARKGGTYRIRSRKGYFGRRG